VSRELGMDLGGQIGVGGPHSCCWRHVCMGMNSLVMATLIGDGIRATSATGWYTRIPGGIMPPTWRRRSGCEDEAAGRAVAG